jgi:hypothetical protein
VLDVIIVEVVDAGLDERGPLGALSCSHWPSGALEGRYIQ